MMEARPCRQAHGCSGPRVCAPCSGPRGVRTRVRVSQGVGAGEEAEERHEDRVHLQHPSRMDKTPPHTEDTTLTPTQPHARGKAVRPRAAAVKAWAAGPTRGPSGVLAVTHSMPKLRRLGIAPLLAPVLAAALRLYRSEQRAIQTDASVRDPARDPASRAGALESERQGKREPSRARSRHLKQLLLIPRSRSKRGHLEAKESIKSDHKRSSGCAGQ